MAVREEKQGPSLKLVRGSNLHVSKLITCCQKEQPMILLRVLSSPTKKLNTHFVSCATSFASILLPLRLHITAERPLLSASEGESVKI